MGGARITRTTLQNGILMQLAVVSVHEDRACLHFFNGGGARNSSTTRYFVPMARFRMFCAGCHVNTSSHDKISKIMHACASSSGQHRSNID
jgi:hypothetical protein